MESLYGKLTDAILLLLRLLPPQYKAAYQEIAEKVRIQKSISFKNIKRYRLELVRGLRERFAIGFTSMCWARYLRISTT